MLENYLEFKLNGEKAYIKKDNLNQMKKINGIVFDCDGVLINIKESYNRTIKEVVVYLIEGLIGCNIPKNLISDPPHAYQKLIILYTPPSSSTYTYQENRPFLLTTFL